MLDEIILFLNTANNQTDGLHVLTIICNELASIVALKFFNNVHIMDHKFFIIIGRTLEMLLTKATFIPMAKQDEQCFYETTNLIVNLCLYKNKPLTCFYTSNDDDLSPAYQKIFLTKSFFDKLTRFITDDLAINNYEPYHVKYKVIGRLLYLCTELNNINHNLLLDSIVQCLRSDCYLNAYETIDLREPILNPKQLFFIHQCPQFIIQHNFIQQEKITSLLCKTFIEATKSIFDRRFSATGKNSLHFSYKYIFLFCSKILELTQMKMEIDE